jgi:isopentenyl phosphate kinase
MEPQSSLYLVKFGGSLITDKSKPHTPRTDVLVRLAREVAEVYNQGTGIRLIVGHGSGSFGHVPAKRYGTRQGVYTPEQWSGFAEVWFEATSLTRLVVEAFYAAGLPVVAFSPSASVTSRDGRLESWNLDPIRAALDAGLIPIVHGDVVFDSVRGGTILSTEDLFEHLAGKLSPRCVLFAGLEQGVWADYPQCMRLVTEITRNNLAEIFPALQGSAQVDVTGGMLSKVQQSLAITAQDARILVRIFSGETPGNVSLALKDLAVGTAIHGG